MGLLPGTLGIGVFQKETALGQDKDETGTATSQAGMGRRMATESGRTEAGAELDLASMASHAAEEDWPHRAARATRSAYHWRHILGQTQRPVAIAP